MTVAADARVPALTHLRWRRLLCALLGGMLALAIYRAPLGSLSLIWPGRIATLPIALLFGPWFGLLAATVGGLPYLTTTPAMMAVFWVEATIVGIFARRGWSSLAAGALVWAMAALALALRPGWFGFKIPPSTLFPLALQRMLSGISTVVIAELVCVAISSRWPTARARSETRGLRTYSFHAFALVAVAPALLLSTGTVLVIGARQMVEGSGRLRDSAMVLSDHIDEYLGGQTRAIEALAATLTLVGDDPARHQRMLDEYVKILTGFESFRIVSLDGDVIAAAPPLPTLTRLSVRDRAFFTGPLLTHKPTISDVNLGRLRPVSIVAISAPMFSAPDHVSGVTYGVLDLARFRHFVERYQGSPDANVVILDQLNRVIYTSERSPYTLRQDLSDDE
jgi:hypothetical protein